MALSIQDISTEYLPVLENLMSEYFDTTSATNAARKEEIKQIVNAFAQEDNAWCYAIKFICESKSDYAKVYCFGVLHNFILKNWHSLTEQVKTELRDYVWTNLIRFHINRDHSIFIQTKLCQIISTIVRLSYPNFWPNYFNQDLANLISNLETTKLGIRLLNITLEDLLMPSEDLFEDRKVELARLVSIQVPLIVNMISSILQSICNKCMGSLYVTPPASPIESGHFQALQETHDENHIIYTANRKQINLKSICLSIKNLLDNIDSDSLELLELTLRCNATLFNWLPIDDFYPLLNESMLELLFIFATFGCSNGQKETTIGILTLTCINELLSKNYVQNEFSCKFYFVLFEIVFKVLLIVDNEIALENLEHDYLMKFIESIRLFSANQMFIPSDANFFLNFLEKLFYLTFKPKWNAFYQALLEIWTNLLDIYINNNPDHRIMSNDQDPFRSKLYMASNELFKQVLFKLQYRFNVNQLEDMNGSQDFTDEDDCEQNEHETFFIRNVELLSKIAQLIPDETQKILGNFFEELVKVFLNMDQLLGQAFSLEHKQIITERLSHEDANNLDYALKDFAVLIRVWQRLSEHFIGTNFDASLQTVQTLLDMVLNCLSYSNRLKLFTFNCDNFTIVQDLNELHQGLLLFLKFYSSWITQYRSQSSKSVNEQEVLNLLLKKICEECVNSIEIVLDDQDYNQDPKLVALNNSMVVQSSLLCLLTVSCSIRPNFLLELTCMKRFCERLHSSINTSTCPTCLMVSEKRGRFINIGSDLKSDSCKNCRFADQLTTLPINKCTSLRIEAEQELIWIDTLSNMLILPWSQSLDNEQQWDKRAERHKTFVYSFYSDLLKQFQAQPSSYTQRIPVKTQVGNTLKRTLFLLTNLVNNHVESQTKSKQLLLASLAEFLEFTLVLLPANTLNDELGDSMLSFLIAVLEVFRIQVKLSFIEQIIKTLLNCISNNALVDSDQEFRNSLIEKLFKIFTFIVQQPTSNFKTILPDMLDVALHQMYHTVAHSNSHDLHMTFYEFLYKFMLNNSKFFFKSPLLNHQFNNSLSDLNSNQINRNQSNSLLNEQTDNQQYFFRIFEIFGNSFVTMNMNLFKQNLAALDALNFRGKLFHKKLFRENLLHHFIHLFVQTMVNNEHKILHDELTSIVFSLASVDYDLFKKILNFEFINKLTNCSNVTFNQQYGRLLNSHNIEDAPTFNKQLNQLVSGLRFYEKSHSLLI